MQNERCCSTSTGSDKASQMIVSKGGPFSGAKAIKWGSFFWTLSVLVALRPPISIQTLSYKPLVIVRSSWSSGKVCKSVRASKSLKISDVHRNIQFLCSLYKMFYENRGQLLCAHIKDCFKHDCVLERGFGTCKWACFHGVNHSDL